MKNKKRPCVLTIAGTDPSGGAGIQADIKSISATGSYAASVITVLVAQNTQGVQGIQEIPIHFIEQQIHSVFNDLIVDAVKIGMLHHQDIVNTVYSALTIFKPPIIVLDPVMVSKHGYALLKPDTVDSLKRKLISCATLITPNIFEAEKLLMEKIKTPEDMARAAKKLGNHFHINVLLKGGHLTEQTSNDVLYTYQKAKIDWFYAEHINTKNTHGTGCSLSSAIASYLAQSYSLKESIEKAKQYISHAIKAASMMQIGQGCGPLDHFYFLY